ncbi:MAG: type II toxin-antitoxin system PemK/MazF family toxin [bacterium]
MHRGEIWWASLGEPEGSAPGYRRPVLVVQSDEFNRSRISTIIVAALTSNIALAQAPGNVLIKARHAGLSKDSVVNVSQVITVDKQCLTEKIKKLESSVMAEVENGLRLVLAI